METNKKTDWQQFLVINSWLLHLSLRAHTNYIVAVWTFKRSDVINLFRVTMGSAWWWGFYTCGIAVLQPHFQDTFCSCQQLPWGAATGKEGCGQASLSSISLRGSSFCPHWDPKLRPLFHSRWGMNVTQRSVPSWAFLGNPGAVAAVAAPTFPDHNSLHPRPWKAEKNTPPLLLP